MGGILGLDLIVEGCARPGHEAEWRGLVERAFADDTLTEAETARFQEICIPAYERAGAPRVGQDEAANAWILETREARTPEEQAATLKEFDGYHVLALVKSDGVPEYTHGGLYDGVDLTSFRGAFLTFCTDVLSKAAIEDAWNHKLPEAAIAYGRALLDAADGAKAPPSPPPKKGFLARLGLGKGAPEAPPFDEQLAIVRAAGRWFVYWGERGHPIRAWF